MSRFTRICAAASVAAVALAGPAAVGAASAHAARPAVTADVVNGTIECHPEKLRAKAARHSAVAAAYRHAYRLELAKPKPSQKSAMGYLRKYRARADKAHAYLAEAKRCEGADRRA